MPHVKTETIQARNEAGQHLTMKVKICVNASGEFYCKVPDPIAGIVQSDGSRKAGVYADTIREQVYAPTMQTLILALTVAFKESIVPRKREEIVIRYNIESHVSFAVAPDGAIGPNARFCEGAKWDCHDDKYGNHHATNLSDGGYSLTVGARAYRKITYTRGEHETVEYENYYGKGDHLRQDCPASILNAWTGLYLGGEECREMPYTDEAAEFFHQLMLGMAEISRKIQTLTFEQDDLLALIASGQNLLTHTK